MFNIDLVDDWTDSIGIHLGSNPQYVVYITSVSVTKDNNIILDSSDKYIPRVTNIYITYKDLYNFLINYDNYKLFHSSYNKWANPLVFNTILQRFEKDKHDSALKLK